MELGALRTQHTETLAELDRYRILVESVEEYAIFLLDTDGNILTWNRGAEKIKGYIPSEIIGKHFSIFYLSKDKQAGKPERELELAKQYGRVEDEDWRVRKDGSRFWANVVITALRDVNGELVGYAKVTRDVTDRKQHENEMRDANAVLLRQRRDLERLNKSKDDFIMLASHQLRTPATSVKQFLGLLLEGFMGDLTPRQLEYVQLAFDSNERQIAIVNDLLRVAQVDGGRVILNREPTDMVELVARVLSAQKDLFRMRKQHVSERAESGLPNAFIDSGNFRMVLENLIDNASKYTPAGGTIVVTISVEEDHMRIVVEDSGVGIAPADQTKLFQKFTRIPNALSGSVGGSGLGLYWVNKIVELHGGRIEVESDLGKGTSFNIIIPIKEEHA